MPSARFSILTTAPTYQLPDLIARIAQGDERAFRSFYDIHWNRIYSTALAFTQSHQHAMDIVQETFLRCWRNRERLSTLDNVEAFLYTIAKNRIKTLLHRHRDQLIADRFATIDPADPAASPESKHALKQFHELVHSATELLPAQQAQVFRLSRFEQLSYEEIATALSISPATVRNHLIKALNFMRTHFAERYQDLLFLLAVTGHDIFIYFFNID